MTLLSLMIHPISLVISQVLITALAISFTHPSSLLRPAALPLLITATWLITVTCLQHIPRLSLASIVAGNGPTYLLQYIDLGLLSRWSYETGGPTDPSGPGRRNQGKGVDAVGRNGSTRAISHKSHLSRTALLVDRLRFGIDTTISSRHVNTPWEVKNVPPFSSSDLHYLPSRGSFLRYNAVVVLFCYLVVDAFSLGVQPESNAVLFASENIPFFTRLRDVSMEQVAIRIVSSLTVWLNIYCITRMGYSILGTIVVGMGISQVSAWRPPFGRLADAYTLRQFWG